MARLDAATSALADAAPLKPLASPMRPCYGIVSDCHPTIVDQGGKMINGFLLFSAIPY
ncbi:hypothetical protein HM1_2730 [Heliomicrobium modesticaldum Ice1]|uniref:Uncharacterized protein n=1 Tax=Heliobacterium modesticaldum (strain ATCC 51547 / Ice1) TaxID=498761 RepID=B0TBY6_HELMI|nr:hypothetical protein HM1_2730 [Heliomicrobium modesticaldum Ice1]